MRTALWGRLPSSRTKLSSFLLIQATFLTALGNLCLGLRWAVHVSISWLVREGPCLEHPRILVTSRVLGDSINLLRQNPPNTQLGRWGAVASTATSSLLDGTQRRPAPTPHPGSSLLHFCTQSCPKPSSPMSGLPQPVFSLRGFFGTSNRGREKRGDIRWV